ncbi:uncharacterized protein LOC118509234 [Anopheles stephensi]|uniref:uncharacterized protein LOC118509234 n=1 Tax=Anopheles stephensi TaxID=30069 RepID=UPI0016589649|nr:uncharacterized protein LOC118509234 [Anopheles stephensi]
MLIRFITFLLSLHVSKTLHLMENAKWYEEKLGDVQEIAAFVCVNLHLDLVKHRHEAELLTNGSQTLHLMCEQLIESKTYDRCKTILRYDLPDYSTLADQIRLSTSEARYSPDDHRKKIQYQRTVTLDMFSYDIFNQNLDSVNTSSNAEVLAGMLQDLAQTVTRKQQVVSMLTKPIEDDFYFKSLHSLMTLSERNQLLAKIVYHCSTLKYAVNADVTTLIRILEAVHCKRFVSNDHILVKLSVPLVKEKNYKALKLTILPAVNDDVLVFPQIDKDVFFVDENKHFVGSINYSTFRNVCQSLSGTFICNFARIRKDKNAPHNCVSALVFGQRTTACQTLVMRSKQNVWLATQNPNSWLYIFPRKESMLLTVDGKRTKKTFHGTGLFNLVPNSTAQSDSFVIRYTNEPHTARGQIRPLPFNVSCQTINAMSILNGSEPQSPTSRVLLTQEEKHFLFASGIDENLLHHLWKMQQASTEDDPNTVLYNVLTVITLVIVMFCLLIVSLCDTGKQDLNAHHDKESPIFVVNM